MKQNKDHNYDSSIVKRLQGVTFLMTFLISVLINCHRRYMEPSLMSLICLFCLPNRPGPVNCSFCDNRTIMNVSFPLEKYLEQLIHLIWLFGWSANWLIDCVYLCTLLDDKQHEDGCTALATACWHQPLIKTLHSLWSTFTVESFSCLLRCPGDPVLIRSLRHREPMQQSCWEKQGENNLKHRLAVPSPWRSTPEWMHQGFERLIEASQSWRHHHRTDIHQKQHLPRWPWWLFSEG